MADDTRRTKRTKHAERKKVKLAGYSGDPQTLSVPTRRWSPSVIFLVFVVVAALGYVAGTYNTQIFNTIAPVFGVKTTNATLDLSSVEQTYQELKSNFDGTLSDQALIDGANKGLVAAANDTYTLYMNKADAAAFNDDLTGNIGGGIGAEISLRNNQPTIIAVLDNNPAKAAGLLAGDTILDINDQSVSGMTVDDAVAKIRGQVGTTVKLTIQRGSETKTFSVTRATVSNPSVTSTVSGTLGTMTITRFDQDTATEAQSAAQDFVKAGVKKVILDLRDNGGGYLTAAQSVAGLWLDNQVVVSEKTNGVTTDTLKSDSNPLLKGLPTVVLVNGSSASASEIVSGALQDYKVATLIGEKTFGKGSVQKLIDLDNDAELKVTIARWYTPNGKNIDKQGITPDKVVDLTSDDSNVGRDPQLDAAKAFLGL